MPEELWMEVRDIVQETGMKTMPREKKCKKAKWLSEEALARGKSHGFSRVAAGTWGIFSSYDGDAHSKWEYV